MPSLFRDADKLDFEYVPDELPHRSREMRILGTLYRPMLLSNISCHSLITGRVGSGKTVLAKKFFPSFRAKAAKQKVGLEHIFVNCKKHSTAPMAMRKILTYYEPRFNRQGQPLGDMFTDLKRHITKRRTKLIVVLDEIDIVLKNSGDSLIYGLTRINEGERGPKASVSVCLVSAQYIQNKFSEATLSTFGRANTVELKGYNQKQLVTILSKRVELAYWPGAVRDNSIELIADIAAGWGDARYAIEILLRAGMTADEKREEEVTPEHVRTAKAMTYSYITNSKLNELNKHEKLALLAVARTLRDEAYATLQKVKKTYDCICEEYEEVARGKTQFWKYVNHLEDLGLVDTKKAGKGGQANRVVWLQEIPTKELEDKLVGLIGG